MFSVDLKGRKPYGYCMVATRSRFTLSETADRSLVLSTQPFRRVIFAGISLILVIAFLVSVDYERDFSSENLFGTVFYFLLAGGSAVIAGWDEKTMFCRERESIVFYRRIFGVSFLIRCIPFDEVTAVLFIHDAPEQSAGSEYAAGDPKKKVFHSGESGMYYAYIETVGERVLLEQAPERKEIEEIADLIAQFLETPFIRAEQ
jgi:hypothetical protein